MYRPLIISFVQNHPAVLLAVISSLLLLPPATIADETQSTTPFAMVVFAGLDRFAADLAMLSDLSGSSAAIDRFNALKTELGHIPGFDRTRPVGGLLLFNREQPDQPFFLIALPVTDGQQLVQSLQIRFPILQTVAEHEWSVTLPDQTLLIHLQKEHLLIGQSRETFAAVTPELIQTFDQRSLQHDFSISIHRAGIPDAAIQEIANAFEKDLARELEPKPDEADALYRIRANLISFVQQLGRQLLSTTESIDVGLEVTTEIKVTANLAVQPDSKLSQIFAAAPLSKSSLPLPEKDDIPFQLRLGLHVPQPLQQIALELFKVLREVIRKEIGPKLAKEDRGPVGGAFDTIEQTVRHGVLDSVITFQETDKMQMVLVGGLSTLDTDRLTTSLETLLPYMRESEDIAEVNMEMVSNDQLRLHGLRGKHASENDKRLYGAVPTLYVGTGPDSFWLAVGGPQTPLLLKTWQEAPSAPVSPTILETTFSLDPWLRLAEKDVRDAAKLRKFRHAFPDGKDDQIHLKLTADSHGLHLTGVAEQGYLRALGASIEKKGNDDKTDP